MKVKDEKSHVELDEETTGMAKECDSTKTIMDQLRSRRFSLYNSLHNQSKTMENDKGWNQQQTQYPKYQISNEH